MHPFLEPPTPHLFAHRGASGECPENTLPAFDRAWQTGVPFLEMDCHATRDGEIVVHHDAHVDRLSDGTGPIAEFLWKDLARFDAGYRFTADGRSFPFRGCGVRIPLLADVIERYPEARINLEIKQADPPIAERVVGLIRELGAAERMLLASEQDAVIASIRALDPGTASGSSLRDAVNFFAALDGGRIAGFEPMGQALQIPPRFGERELVTEQSVAAAHRLGLLVHVWTVNDADEMRRLLDLGVDGIMSDFPDRLIEVAREHGSER
ncbi:MAG: glycerophosphodiester phosphodiesterase [Myxococcales bacterium]|nr:glycerophosphodiester phosphodiesterase [Myxococcales bacterium]